MVERPSGKATVSNLDESMPEEDVLEALGISKINITRIELESVKAPRSIRLLDK